MKAKPSRVTPCWKLFIIVLDPVVASDDGANPENNLQYVKIIYSDFIVYHHSVSC